MHRGIIMALLLAGLLLRIGLAHEEGDGFDISVNQGWAKSAVLLGAAESYTAQVDDNMLPNYPPLSLLVFAGTGHAYRALISSEYDSSLLAYRLFIKLPAIIADLLTASLLYVALRRWSTKRYASFALTAYLFHPAVIYESAVWGQTDAIFTLLLLASPWSYCRTFFVACGALAVCAFLTKAQAVMIAPMLLLALLVHGGWRATLRAAGGGLAAAFVVLLPFLRPETLTAIKDVYLHSVGFYPILSSAAYNFWWMLFSDASTGFPDTDIFLAGMSFRTVGFLLFGLSQVFILGTLWAQLRRKPGISRLASALFLAASLSCLGFFLFNTQMHERYLFPLMTFGLPLLFLHQKTAPLYGLASICFFFNLVGYLPYGGIDKWLFARIPTLDVLIAVTLFCIFCKLAAVAWRDAGWSIGALPWRRATRAIIGWPPRSSRDGARA